MRRRIEASEGPGQDSFLDIVANLVGILIILVMVVGARAKDALIEAVPEQPEVAEQTTEEIDIKTPQRAAQNLEKNINDLDQRLQQQGIEIAYRQKERDTMLVLIKKIEHRIEEQAQTLDDADRETYQVRSELAAATNAYEDLKRTREAIKTAVVPPTVMRHLPTPMAKTVFGKELHLRLQAGRLAFVPLEEFAEQLKANARNVLERARNQDEITDMMGPLDGFRMRFTFRRQTRVGTVGGSAVSHVRFELDKFELIPVTEYLGEPLVQALQSGSEFQELLRLYDPNKTTVTVWTYPDSFKEFRQLKDELFRRGYLTASRPLPAGQLIGGSPRGTHSAAQ